MKFKVGDKVRVVNPYSGGNFKDGDVVTIEYVEFDGADYYGAISPHDNIMWFLDEKEVTTPTNADKIRSMTDNELANFLNEWEHKYHSQMCEYEEIEHWLKEPY